MKIGILAVQGAFAEHGAVLDAMGIPHGEIRCKEDLQRSFDGIILPGGESTVQGKLLRELELFSPIRQWIEGGMPVLATCAGMILLAQKIEGQDDAYFQTVPITVRRNAYGRQLGSFHTEDECSGAGRVPMTFIRAPYVTQAEKGVSILSTVQGHIVAVRYQNQIALSFHPELDHDYRLHQMFLDLCS